MPTRDTPENEPLRPGVDDAEHLDFCVWLLDCQFLFAGNPCNGYAVWRSSPVIKSFSCSNTKLFFQTGIRPGWMPPSIERRAGGRLDMLAAATTLSDLRQPPSLRLKSLHGRLAGRYSIRINDQWRIIFRWQDPDAFEVAIIDYH